MIPSTLFALVGALSSLAAVNGAVIQRGGTVTDVTPQPTVPGQGTGVPTTSLQSPSATSTPSVTGTSITTPATVTSPTTTLVTTKQKDSGTLSTPTATVTPPTTTSVSTTQSSDSTSIRHTTPKGSSISTPTGSVTSPTTTSVTTTQSSDSTSTKGSGTTSTPTTTVTSPTTTSVTITQSPSSTPTRSTTPTGSGTISTTLPTHSDSKITTTAAIPTASSSSTTLCPGCIPTGVTRRGSSGADCNGVQQWQASFAYTAGNRAIFNGQLFTARQWTYNNAPPTHPDQWTADGTCVQPVNNQANCNGVAAWQSTVAYTTGNRATFNGHLWSAVQWSQSNTPGDTSGTWMDQGACV